MTCSIRHAVANICQFLTASKQQNSTYDNIRYVAISIWHRLTVSDLQKSRYDIADIQRQMVLDKIGHLEDNFFSLGFSNWGTLNHYAHFILYYRRTPTHHPDMPSNKDLWNFISTIMENQIIQGYLGVFLEAENEAAWKYVNDCHVGILEIVQRLGQGSFQTGLWSFSQCFPAAALG